MRYGDNVEDEWIAISLIYGLSRQHANIICRVWDCDGEVFCPNLSWSSMHSMFHNSGVQDAALQHSF